MKRQLATLAGLAALVVSPTASASPPDKATVASSWASSRSLQDHFGIEVARRLVRGEDLEASAVDDALRGIDRAVSLGNDDAVFLLVKLLNDAHGIARGDSRVLLAATRGLAPFASQRTVARTLAETVLNAPSAPTQARRADEDERPSTEPDVDRQARLELARGTAALALAGARDAHATDLLLLTARGGGPGQSAARAALLTTPPLLMPPPAGLTPTAIALSVALGDLRAVESNLEATRSLEPSLRVAALRRAGAFQDARALPAARLAIHDANASVRTAAGQLLVDLGAPEAPAAVRMLIEDDATAASGVELSLRVAADEVVGALAARVRVSSDASLRAAAIAALGRQPGPRSLGALHELMADPLLVGDAAEAIARSNDAGAWPLIAAAFAAPGTRRLAARMAALRGRLAGRVPANVTGSLEGLARATDGADRAAGVAALGFLGDDVLARGLADADARVRRAAAMACEPTAARCAKAMLRRLATETDPLTRLVLRRGLACEGEAGSLTTLALRERLREGDVDAPLAVLALARRGEEAERGAVLEALASSDPILRAHAALGLAQSRELWASERLAHAYDLEADTGVRRTIVVALAARIADESVPSRARALDLAARLDPDPTIRAIAERAERGLPAPELPEGPSAAWLRTMDAKGEPPASPVTASVLRSDGLAIPVVFDDDGYALSPASIGPMRLLLAPRLRAYEPLPHAE